MFERENYTFVFDQNKLSFLKKDTLDHSFLLFFASFPSMKSGRNSLEIDFHKKDFNQKIINFCVTAT